MAADMAAESRQKAIFLEGMDFPFALVDLGDRCHKAK
jgi:hypothetical protein